MNLALFNLDGAMFLLRWFHFFFGIIWIGLLYYFNFVQGAFFAETDATTKSNAIQKLLPRALWWFRWGAMFTVITGLTYLAIKGHLGGFDLFTTSYGVTILMGMTLGLFMWGNVWFVIWPNQKIVIASAEKVAQGGAALPEAAAAGARALVASRTNTMFSIPMLFFMGAASHLSFNMSPTSHYGALAGSFAVILLALEWNALRGKTGPLTTVRGVIHCGFALAAVLYGLVEICA
ncbi:MAG: urate hydroxylase PuuD [Bdellovibrionia bacterium]